MKNIQIFTSPKRLLKNFLLKAKFIVVIAVAVAFKKSLAMEMKFLSVLIWLILTCYAINSNAQNTKYGTDALKNTSGSFNSAFGYFSMFTNTTGTRNTAIGYRTLYSNMDGSYNTTMGKQSMFSNIHGNANTAIGYEALYYNDGSFNTASGYKSLWSNITGEKNTANGYEALLTNNASENTGNGYRSLRDNASGKGNTAIGYASLSKNITGSSNTATGRAALYYNIDGNYNTANGHSSLYNSKSSGNTASGYASLITNTIGFNNTALGFNADVTTGSLTNATAIGYNAKVDASDKVRIGNDFVTSIGGKVGWTTFSDGRYKRDIKENVPGLEFIKGLRPVTYTVNIKGLNEYHNKGRKQVSDSEDSDNAISVDLIKAEDAAGKIVYSGFIAQEVEEAAKKLNFEFSGVDKPQSKDGLYGLRYDNFIVPLVKAVQELSQQNEELKNKVEKLETLLGAQSNDNSKTSQTVLLTSASLEQNAPNPFNSNTTIRYRLPASAGNAQIMVTNTAGITVKAFAVTKKDAGSVTINAGELAAGSYYYSLMIDGKKVDSKKMILVK